MVAAYLGQTLNKNNCRAADAKTQEVLGCTKELPEYLWMDIHGITVRGCAYCEVSKTPMVSVYMRLHKFFLQGHLPSEGGIINQNPVLMDAFEIINRIEAGKSNGRQSD